MAIQLCLVPLPIPPRVRGGDLHGLVKVLRGDGLVAERLELVCGRHFTATGQGRGAGKRGVWVLGCWGWCEALGRLQRTGWMDVRGGVGCCCGAGSSLGPDEVQRKEGSRLSMSFDGRRRRDWTKLPQRRQAAESGWALARTTPQLQAPGSRESWSPCLALSSIAAFIVPHIIVRLSPLWFFFYFIFRPPLAGFRCLLPPSFVSSGSVTTPQRMDFEA